jgi:uncharacterized membrane protein
MDIMTNPMELATSIGDLKSLDPAASALRSLVRPLSQPGRLRWVLSGEWLGHPLHPVLTDVAIGAWTMGGFLDVFGGKRRGAGADTLIGLGTLAALPTAVTGLSDWGRTGGKAARIGLVHGVGNVVAVSLFGLSWLARRGGHRASGKALSTLGLGVATGTAYLGGHLVFQIGVGVGTVDGAPLPSRSATSAAGAPEGRNDMSDRQERDTDFSNEEAASLEPDVSDEEVLSGEAPATELAETLEREMAPRSRRRTAAPPDASSSELAIAAVDADESFGGETDDLDDLAGTTDEDGPGGEGETLDHLDEMVEGASRTDEDAT